MTVVLLANVGNHDLQLRDRSLLPEQFDAQAMRWARILGEEIRERLSHYRGALTMPLVGPTVRWILEREAISPDDLHVVLFASAQQYAPDQERQKDTKPFAEVMKQLLAAPPFQLPAKHIRIISIDGNPSDYANMLAFYTGALPGVADFAEWDQVYLEVSGGTPAMTAMLIVAGVEVFDLRARTLYLDRAAEQPHEVGIAEALFARQTRATLVQQIELHAYAVARATLDASGPLITPDARQRDLLDALLDYADRRLAFDFERARAALDRAQRLTTGSQQARLGQWLRELRTPSEAHLLAELVHSTRIKLHLGDYADMVQRLFRFQEAAFRYMAEQMGMAYSKPRDNRYVSKRWVQAQPGLGEFLEAYRPPGASEPIKVIVASRSLNRFSLGAIVDFFVQSDPAWTGWRTVAQDLHRLSALADLRNKGLAGHGFEGIGREDLEAAFGQPPDTLPVFLDGLLTALFDQDPGPDPYQAVNEVLTRLAQEDA